MRIQRSSIKKFAGRRIEKLLMGGIFVFASSVVLMHFHLMKIESTYAGRDLRNDGITPSKRKSSRSSTKKYDGLPPDLDPRLQKNNNWQNPGRAWGSEKGRVKCDVEVYRLISYWNDPRSNVDRAFQSPFLETPSAFIKRPKRKRYLSFEPDMVRICCIELL